MEVVIYSGWEGKGGAGYGERKISFSEIFNIVQCLYINKYNIKSKRKQTAKLSQNRKNELAIS